MSLPETLARPPWYRSLRFKLVAVAILVEVSMLGLLLANSHRLITQAVEVQTQARLDALRPLLTASLAGRVFQRDHSEIDAILQQLLASPHTEIRYILVKGPRGEPIGAAGDTALTTDPDDSVLAALTGRVYHARMPLLLGGATRVGEVWFGLSLALPAKLRENILRQSLFIATAAILLSLLLLVWGGYLLTRHIDRLLSATRRIANGDYDTQIPSQTRDEIGILTDNFNAMAREIQQRVVALAESESRFRCIFDSAGDAIFLYDAVSGRLLDVNRRMCEMYRCNRAQALEAGHDDMPVNLDHYAAEGPVAQVRTGLDSGPQTFEWLARTRDGERFWVEVNLHRVQIGQEEHIIALVRDISERKRHQQELEFLAHHDPLTQLPNRLLFHDRLQQAIAHVQRAGRLLAVAYLDVDSFKPVNDRLGHEVGDRLLVEVAKRLQDGLRAGDTACRFGGDEFVLLVGDLTSRDEWTRTFSRLLELLSVPYRLNQETIRITVSIGLTLFPADDVDGDTLLRHADQAMYIAKQQGGNRIHLFDPEHDRLARAHYDAYARITEALDRDEFVLHYQPQVDMQGGRIIGVEALIRWQHPQEGLLAPARFLPVVEDSDFIIPLGEWVLDTVLKQMAAWRSAGLALRVGVNIAARQLQQPDFSARLAALLARNPAVPPQELELEVVESAALEDLALVERVIDECHALGVTFALDDFGTGYSSLSYFKRLKVDRLKIDQSFIRNMPNDPEDYAIVEGVIALTRSFRREVIAEGVENKEIGAMLLEMGCHQGQGYGIARPMPAAAVASWAERWVSGLPVVFCED